MFFLIPLYGKNAEVFFIKMSAVLFTNFHKNEKNVKKQNNCLPNIAL